MKPSDVLEDIEGSALNGRLPIIGPVKGAMLDDLVRSHSPTRALEIGTLVGYSAIRISRLLPEGGELTCVEVSASSASAARSNIEKAGLSGRVRVLVGDAKEVLGGLQGPVDFVLVDANKDEYLAYIRACEPLLRPGSVVVADNVIAFADRVAGYLEYVRNSGKYSSRTIRAPLNADQSVEDGMEVSVKL